MVVINLWCVHKNKCQHVVGIILYFLAMADRPESVHLQKHTNILTNPNGSGSKSRRGGFGNWLQHRRFVVCLFETSTNACVVQSANVSPPSLPPNNSKKSVPLLDCVAMFCTCSTNSEKKKPTTIVQLNPSHSSMQNKCLHRNRPILIEHPAVFRMWHNSPPWWELARLLNLTFTNATLLLQKSGGFMLWSAGPLTKHTMNLNFWLHRTIIQSHKSGGLWNVIWLPPCLFFTKTYPPHRIITTPNHKHNAADQNNLLITS